MRIIGLLCLSFLSVACSMQGDKEVLSPLLNDRSEGVFIAKYGDFGPPQLAGQLLGDKWWQWNDPENHKPVTYDVKVVVYRGVSLADVERAFPVNPALKQDYRYVEYTKADLYFTKVITDFELEIGGYDTPEDVGMMCIYPLALYKTALAMHKKLLH